MSFFSREAWRFELIHRNYSAASLKLATIWVYGIWLVKVLHESMPRISALPYSVYEPLGLIRAAPSSLRPLLLSHPFLEGLRALVVVALLAVIAVMIHGFRRERRAAPEAGAPPESAVAPWSLLPAVLACALLTLYQGLFRGFAGHISHEDTLLIYAAYLLAAFPIADLISRRAGPVDPRANLSALPVVSILATMCAIYTIVSVYRLLYGAPTVFTNGSLTYWALRNTVDVLDPGPGLGFSLADHRWVELFFAAGFPLITAMELLSPLALVLRPFRVFFIATMVTFHLLTWLYMDVVFRENLALYALFLDPGTLAPLLSGRRAGSTGDHFPPSWSLGPS